MEGCKFGRIPPCYGGKKFRIHEELEKIKTGDETRDRVYELKRQIGDFERRLSDDFLDMQVRITDKLAKDVIEGVRTPDWAKNMLAGIPEQLSRAEYEILEEILKEKNRFMEEKKTKKMTKAEVFEWLDGKKIRTEGNHEKVLRKLFDLGFVWKNLRDTRVDLGWQLGEVYGLTISDDEVAWWPIPHLFETHGADAVTAEDILSLEIVDDEDNIAEKNVFLQARDIMKWLREKQSPHTLMIIDGNHVELLDGVKSEVWKE